MNNPISVDEYKPYWLLDKGEQHLQWISLIYLPVPGNLVLAFERILTPPCTSAFKITLYALGGGGGLIASVSAAVRSK